MRGRGRVRGSVDRGKGDQPGDQRPLQVESVQVGQGCGNFSMTSTFCRLAGLEHGEMDYFQIIFHLGTMKEFQLFAQCL